MPHSARSGCGKVVCVSGATDWQDRQAPHLMPPHLIRFRPGSCQSLIQERDQIRASFAISPAASSRSGHEVTRRGNRVT